MQIGADLEEVANWAAFLGTRPIGSTGERGDFDHERNGMRWYDTTTGAEYLHDGTSWNLIFKRRTSFTPTWSNFTPGASAVAAWYQIVGNICEGFITVTLASGWAMNPNGITFALPVAAANVLDHVPIGQVGYIDNGAGYYDGTLFLNGAGAGRVMWKPAAAFVSGAKSTEPFTFVTGDSIRIHFRYEV